MEEHEEHLRTVLGIFWREKLYDKFNKYIFWLKEIIFVCHEISSGLPKGESCGKLKATFQYLDKKYS